MLSRWSNDDYLIVRLLRQVAARVVELPYGFV
jgi:hypothetical protein